jgi:hypothetical protein
MSTSRTLRVGHQVAKKQLKHYKGTSHSLTEAFDYIQKTHRIVFITGQSTVGKSHFARQLWDRGYNLLMLDDVINEISKDPEIYTIYSYTNESNRHYAELFVEIVRETLQMSGKWVIEGALKNETLIRQIFEGYQYLFCYVMGSDYTKQYQRTQSRIIEDLEEGKRTVPIKYTPEFLTDYSHNGVNGKLFKSTIDQFVKYRLMSNDARIQTFREIGFDVYVVDLDKN